MLQGNARLWEGLIPFALLFEESLDEDFPGPGEVLQVSDGNPRAAMIEAGIRKPAPIKKKAPKHEYDYRVVVANARRD